MQFDFSGLEKLKKSILKGGYVKVGIVSGHAQREKGQATNAYIGMVHERGSLSRGLPPRSWLEMPLRHEKEAITNSTANAVSAHADWLEGGLKKFYAALGEAAVEAIRRAFSSGGFGEWKALKPETIARKRREGSSYPDSILIDSSQLRDNVDYEVVS